MHWITGRGIKTNRAATASLIRRFIDPEAQFVFVKPADVAEAARSLGGVGFHAPGATYPARDEQGRTPFEALVAERCANDEVLREMSVIVRHADRPEADPVPEAAGLYRVCIRKPLQAGRFGLRWKTSTFL